MERLHRHGIERKTWMHLPDAQQLVVMDFVAMLHSELQKVLKNKFARR
jgi:hypothetical protein